MSCYEKFHKLLREHGFRLTPQREAIVVALHQVQGRTVTAEEVHGLVQDSSAGVDLATVYRTLEMLAEIGFVKNIDTGRKERQWQFLGAEESHPHLLCRSCGKLYGVAPDDLAALAEELRARYGFDIDIGQVTLPGLCPECREREG